MKVQIKADLIDCLSNEQLHEAASIINPDWQDEHYENGASKQHGRTDYSINDAAADVLLLADATEEQLKQIANLLSCYDEADQDWKP